MTRSLLLLLAIVSTVAAACSGDAVTRPTPTTVRNVLATRAPVSSPLPPLAAPAATLPPAVFLTPTSLPASQVPTPAPTALARFCCLRFATTPDAEPAEYFPAGTDTVYALWDYKELAADDRIRRIWFRDDLIWLTRDEPWNWAAYGASGTVRDIAVYDHEGTGLPPARYRLQLYLNDALLVEGAFTIAAP